MSRCVKCGFAISDTAEFCEYCGAKQVKVKYEVSVVKSSGSKFKWFIIFLFVVIMTTLIAVDNYNKRHANDPLPEKINTPEMTLSEYYELKMGMSYLEVCKIVGGYGRLTGENKIGGIHTELYTYEGEGRAGANVLLIFQNDKLVQKNESGLK